MDLFLVTADARAIDCPVPFGLELGGDKDSSMCGLVAS